MLDRIPHVFINKLGIVSINIKLKEGRLWWFGHVERRYGHVERRETTNTFRRVKIATFDRSMTKGRLRSKWKDNLRLNMKKLTLFRI